MLVFRIFRGFGDGRGPCLGLRLMLVLHVLGAGGGALRLVIETIPARRAPGLAIARLAAGLTTAGLAAPALVISPLGTIDLTVAAHRLRPGPIGVAVGVDG